MQIPKDQILSLLKGQGDDARPSRPRANCPTTVDTDEHAGLLSSLA